MDSQGVKYLGTSSRSKGKEKVEYAALLNNIN